MKLAAVEKKTPAEKMTETCSGRQIGGGNSTGTTGMLICSALRRGCLVFESTTVAGTCTATWRQAIFGFF